MPATSMNSPTTSTTIAGQNIRPDTCALPASLGAASAAVPRMKRVYEDLQRAVGTASPRLIAMPIATERHPPRMEGIRTPARSACDVRLAARLTHTRLAIPVGALGFGPAQITYISETVPFVAFAPKSHAHAPARLATLPEVRAGMFVALLMVCVACGGHGKPRVASVLPTSTTVAKSTTTRSSTSTTRSTSTTTATTVPRTVPPTFPPQTFPPQTFPAPTLPPATAPPPTNPPAPTCTLQENTSVPSGSSITIVLTGPPGPGMSIEAVQDGGTDGFGQGTGGVPSGRYSITFTVRGAPGTSYTVHGRAGNGGVATCTSQFFVS
jgi:hypothetical protein